MAEKIGAGITAMVADDHPNIRQVLVTILEDFGCRVLVAENGDEAVAHLEKEDVAIQMLDIQMPKLDGFGVLKQMRERESELAQPMTIIVTGNTDVEDRIKGTELGAIDFLDKPFRAVGARLRIERLISMVKMERRVDREQASLAHMRTRDGVTGDGTYAMLRPILDAQFQIARVAQRPLSCLVVCDDSYNDLLNTDGRQAGEDRLKYISSSLNGHLRAADLTFRIDAAEFVVLLPGTDASGIRFVIEKLEKKLSPLTERGASIYFANATYPHPQLSKPNHLFRAASVTLAQARSRDQERVAYFEGF